VEGQSHTLQEPAVSRTEGRGHLVCRLHERVFLASVNVVGGMGRIVNLYRTNKPHGVMLGDIESITLARNHHSQNYKERKHLVFSCSPSQCILRKRDFPTKDILF